MENDEVFLTIYEEETSHPPCNLYFQFNDDEPVLMQDNITGEFTLSIRPTNQEEEIVFTDGNGKSFRFFIKPQLPPSNSNT